MRAKPPKSEVSQIAIPEIWKSRTYGRTSHVAVEKGLKAGAEFLYMFRLVKVLVREKGIGIHP